MRERGQSDIALYQQMPAFAETEVYAQPEAPQNQSLFKLLDDRLRGRWRPMLLVAAALGILLGLAGYRSAVPMYRSAGAIRVTQNIRADLRAMPETKDMPGFERYMNTQVKLIKTHRVLENAARSDAVKTLGWGDMEDTLEELKRGLAVHSDRASELIYVYFDADTPEASQVASNAIITSYYGIYGRSDGEKVGETLGRLENRRDQAVRQQRALRTERDRILSRYETDDLREQQTAVLEEIRRLDEQIVTFQAALEVARSRGDSLADGHIPDVPSPHLEQMDPRLQELRHTRDRYRTEFDFVKTRYRPGTAQYTRAEKRAETAHLLYEEQYLRAIEIWKREAASVTPGQLAEVPQGLAPERIEREIQALVGRVTERRAESQQIMADITAMADLDSEAEQNEAELGTLRTRIDDLQHEEPKLRKGRITIEESGFLPHVAHSDARKKRAIAGMGLGLFASFGAFFLLGTIDRRAYGATQITASSDPYTPACLGVLPDLGHSLRDPESSDVAAHCVHQIRNQIEAVRDPRDGYVLGLTSPHQGDGKTSIVMALGWSYAAAGYKTLLIDCDLVGRALTRQLGMIGRDGIKEAIRANGSGSLAQITPLHVQHLSVLPVGVDARFGPETVRRADLITLLDKVRKEFEIILLDTGPMLGSLESTPVVAAVDGVVLSVRRGRSRTRLEECVARLQSVGANYLGVILNCATRNDCDRYVSEASLAAAEFGRTAEEEQARQSMMHATKAEQNALMLAMENTARTRDGE